MRTKLFLLGTVLLATLLESGAQFAVRTRTTTELEMGTVKFLDIDHGEEKFTLFPPFDWRAESDAASATVRFYAPKGGGVLTLHFSNAEATEALENAEALRKATVPHLRETRVLEEFPAYGGDKTGKGLDLGYVLHGNQMRCRTAVIGLKHGYVSFVLTCGLSDFKTAQQVFGSLMSSFQSAQLQAAR